MPLCFGPRRMCSTAPPTSVFPSERRVRLRAEVPFLPSPSCSFIGNTGAEKSISHALQQQERQQRGLEASAAPIPLNASFRTCRSPNIFAPASSVGATASAARMDC
ncbi:Hypothetical predicted protein [Podarcis lilfordi]|uniref:Uncharacterized protein n=1 Tax=Podarcis lilfordi TaxID=74358 RepID=A0AA35NW58_9SAUR|nr:Hypothetical predicted protein [Podarcis lilfordi]